MRKLAATVALGALIVAGGCGQDDGGTDSDPAMRRQAIERLEDFGLTSEQATCMADELGPDAVVEAGDLMALAEGGDYRAAAKECIDGG